MLREAVAALMAAREEAGLDRWTAEPVPNTVREGGTSVTVFAGPRGPGTRAVAKAWFEERANGVHLFFTNNLKDYGVGGKVLKDGWDPEVVGAVAVAMATSALSDEALIRIVGREALTPSGKVPANRCARELVRGFLRDLRKGVLDPEAVPHVVTETVRSLRDQFDELPRKRTREALGRARDSIRELVGLGVDFQAVRQLWDEEVVRQVQSS